VERGANHAYQRYYLQIKLREFIGYMIIARYADGRFRLSAYSLCDVLLTVSAIKLDNTTNYQCLFFLKI
jgi:hypothetical protein